jgi:ribosome biogenesis protein ERB1
VLTDRELEIIRRIQAGAFPHPEYDAQPEYIPWATDEQEIMPLDGRHPPKNRFIPSKWEWMKVA